MISADEVSYSPNSVCDEFNYKDESLFTATEANIYSASDIMDKFGIRAHAFAHGKFTVAILGKIIDHGFTINTKIGCKSLFGNFQFMPETSSVTNDIRPDVAIYQNEKLVCIFEEDCIQNASFEKSITKACHYSRALCRLISIKEKDQEGMCFVLPSASDDTVIDVQMAVIQVSCQWDYTRCRFSYAGKAIALDDLRPHIQSVIRQQQSVEVTISGDTKYLYKFGTHDLSYFGYRYNHQYPSARSIVLNVSDTSSSNQFVLKFVDSKTLTILQKLKKQITHDSILHYSRDFDFDKRYNSNLSALMYEMLVPPLTAMEAKKCLKDFISLLYTTLQAVHELRFEHCDLRLENICFRRASGSYEVVLIDIDFSAFTNGKWKSTLLSLSKLSCLYRDILNIESVDYHQLGYMIVWVYRYGTELVMPRSKTTTVFESNEHYHNMDLLGELAFDSDKFVGKLITKGELFSFVVII